MRLRTARSVAVVAATAVGLLLLDGRRWCVEGSSRSVESAYDTNKGIFSPQGRLIQLNYVEGIVKRGNLCIGVECKDGVVLMTNKLVTADAAKLLVDGGVRRIYRVDSHIGILPAGLPADGRALAHKAMEYCRSHRREYGEPIPGRLLAERLGDFLHAAFVRWGSRAYPNAVFVACWGKGETNGSGSLLPQEERGDESATVDDNGSALTVRDTSHDQRGNKGGVGDEEQADFEARVPDRDAGFQLYVVDPSGTCRRHMAACTGRGGSRVRKWLSRRAARAPPGKAVQEVEGEDANSSSSSSSTGGGSVLAAPASPQLDREDGDDDDDDEEEEEEDYSGETGEEDRGDSMEGEGDSCEGDERGTATSESGDNPGNERSPRAQRRRPLSLFSQMTCAEAARSLVREAVRVRASEPGKVGARGAGAGEVAGLPEVAWLTFDREQGRGRRGGEEEPVFVHLRSMEDLFTNRR